MKSTLRVTKPATVDLYRLRDWLIDNASSIVAAEQIACIVADFRKLRDFPRLGEGASDQLRHMRVRRAPFVMFYRVAASEVIILRIRHVREDWRDI